MSVCVCSPRVPQRRCTRRCFDPHSCAALLGDDAVETFGSRDHVNGGRTLVHDNAGATARRAHVIPARPAKGNRAERQSLRARRKKEEDDPLAHPPDRRMPSEPVRGPVGGDKQLQPLAVLCLVFGHGSNHARLVSGASCPGQHAHFPPRQSLALLSRASV